VVLVTDPLCYSATDMFAAGFQDHGIGKVVGVGGATGAGGANVWSHQLLRLLLSDLEDDASPYIALPGGADMRVAIRRTTRVGARAGDILEDLGVVPDVVYRMTRRDVMGHNEGLIDRAIRELSATPRQLRISSVQRHRDRAPTVTITTANLTRIDAEVNHRRLASRDVVRNTVRIELGEVVAAGAGGTASVLLLGFDGDELVAERREEVAL
jgi:C-terminal processing protease CtpA/Prc